MRRCMGCMKEYEDGITVCPYCGYTPGTPAREAYHLPPETILNGRYLVGRVIGFGGFGTTYIAWDLMLEKKVAIKEYMPSDFATRAPGETQLSVYDGELGEQFEAGLKSFIDESRRLAKFNHEDGIVHIFDSFLENGTAYIVMEYLEGKTLKELLKERGGRIPYDEAVRYILPILKSLDAVHQTGIIHRDIAPDNIFLTNNGKVKLIDFGASRYATTLHSKSLSVILKQGYAPEEQYRSHGEQGPWSDVYAVCATLYRAITGIVPEDALERCADDKLVPPSKMGINLPNGIENAILNGLNIKAENRIQSANELAQALSGEIEVQRIKEERKKDDVGKWSKRQIVVAALSGVAIIAVVIMAALGVFNLNKSLDTTLYATVPDYIGMNLEEAQENWNEYCKTNGIENISLAISDGIPSDQISGYQVNQIYAISPKAGSWFKKVTKKPKSVYVTIVLQSVQQIINENKGKESWVMQNLENYSKADAQKILESMAGVIFTFENIVSEKKAGSVVRTEPIAGVTINKGDTVVVYISDGSQKKEVETVDLEKNGIKDNIANNLQPGDRNPDSTNADTSSGKPISPSVSSHYTITLMKGNGIRSVVGSGDYVSGTNITVKATVENGYVFTGWISSNVNIISNSNNSSYTFEMPAKSITLTACAEKLGTIIANGKCGDNVFWTFDDKGILDITGKGPMYDFETRGWEGPWAAYLDKILHIRISEGITSIGNVSFEDARNLKSIDIPESITKVGFRAFQGCSSLTNIILPQGVTTINKSTFSNCSSLTTVKLSDNVTIIDSSAFYYCSNLSDFIIPNKVTMIGETAFYWCSNLSNIVIPDTVTKIESRAFNGCTGIKKIIIPRNVEYIGELAFVRCDNLESICVDYRNSKFTSKDGVLFDKSMKTLIAYPNAKKDSYAIPNGVTSILHGAFACSSITDVMIPSSVMNIGDEAFQSCKSLSKVTIEKGVTTIGSYAFAFCDNLKNINLPNSIITIKEHAFHGCNLNSITLPMSVVELGSEVFAYWEPTQIVYIQRKNAPPANWSKYWDNLCNAKIVWNA